MSPTPAERLSWIAASPFYTYTEETVELLRELAAVHMPAEQHLAAYEKWRHDNVRRRPAVPFQLGEVLRAYRHFVSGTWPTPGKRAGSASIVLIASGGTGLTLFDTVPRRAFADAVRELARTNPLALYALNDLSWHRDASGTLTYETDDPEAVARAVADLQDILFDRLTR